MGDDIGVSSPGSDQGHDLVEGDGRLAIQRFCGRLLVLANADGIHDDEVHLPIVSIDSSKSRDDAGSPPHTNQQQQFH